MVDLSQQQVLAGDGIAPASNGADGLASVVSVQLFVQGDG